MKKNTPINLNITVSIKLSKRLSTPSPLFSRRSSRRSIIIIEHIRGKLRSTPLNEENTEFLLQNVHLSSLQSAIPSHPLNFAGLSSFCNDINAINEEFAGIPQVSAKIDELPAGAEVKNRYANVIPLPETRVLLQKINNDPLTEYINASYVRVSEFLSNCLLRCEAIWLSVGQSSGYFTREFSFC